MDTRPSKRCCGWGWTDHVELKHSKYCNKKADSLISDKSAGLRVSLPRTPVILLSDIWLSCISFEGDTFHLVPAFQTQAPPLLECEAERQVLTTV
ncbi:Conotoxin Mr3.8 [Clarias magur]|uniref:Conotoxin Mr3.8 n=1 Tax=Clarias magur TaxID=1594786 RepID=A0A8J4XA40_CLAMG|nr:Conotoxin Mr3.8 [Clarias magur]